MTRLSYRLGLKLGRRQGLRAGRTEGRRQARLEAVAFLYAQADIHRGQDGDRIRRAALHHAADRLRDGHGIGRPNTFQENSDD